VADRLEQPAVIEPVHPFEGGVLNRLERAPRPAPIDHLRLEQADHRLGQSIIVAVADAADGGFDARLGEALGVADAHVLRSAVGMADQAAAGEGAALVQGLLQSIEHEVRPSRA